MINPQSSKSYRTAQTKNEEFFEQIGPEFAADTEIISFKGLKEITIYRNENYGTTFLIEMRFKRWQTAAKKLNHLKYLKGAWYNSGIYKEDIYRIGKSLFLRKLLF